MKKTVFFLLMIIGGRLVAQNDCFSNCIERVQAEQKILLDQHVNFNDSYVLAGMKIINNLKGCSFPKTDLNTLDGRKINIDQLKDSIVLVHFWIPTCDPCIAQITAINQLIEEYKGKKIVFLAVANDAAQNIITFLKEQEKFNAIQTYLDEAAMTKYFCAIAGYPMNIVLDKEGKVIDVWTGGYADKMKQSEFYNRVKALIDANL